MVIMMLFLVILSASLSSAKPKWSRIQVEDNDGVDDNEEVLEVKKWEHIFRRSYIGW